MRSDIVSINNAGKGFDAAVEQTRLVAQYKHISESETTQLQILTEEMLSLALSVTHMDSASFWIEMEDDRAELHMTTRVVLDKEKRAELISSSTSRKNEAAKTFLGRIRDRFEEAMTADPSFESVSSDVLADLPGSSIGEAEWDGYERSILRKMADVVKIGIHKGEVEITVCKRFGAAK